MSALGQPRTRSASDFGALAVEGLPVPAVVLDRDGRLECANAAAVELFGCPDYLRDSPERALGDTSGLQAWLADEPTGETGQWRLLGHRVNGVPIVLDVSASRPFEDRSVALCILHVLSDERLEGEAQRYFDAAFDGAPIGMALFNTDGEYVRVNDALCRLLGRSAGDLIGRRDQEFTHPDDREADIEPAWRILRGEIDSWQCQKRFVRPDGSVVWAIANMTFLRTAEGHPLTWVGQFQDITPQREQEEQLRLAFDDAPTGMALIGLDGTWLKVNHAVCEMTGYSQEELLRKTFQSLTHPDDLDTDLELVRQMTEGEIRSYEMEKRYFRADGSTLWALLAVSLVRSPDGSPGYFVSHIQDITARKKAEEVGEALRADLERSNADLEQFASVVSHDLGQPLAIISGYARLLEGSSDLSDADRNWVGAIIRGSDRMNAMMDGLLGLARVGGQGPITDQCDLSLSVADAIEALAPAIAETGASVEAGDLPVVRGDRTLLSRLFQNLIGNSIKFRSDEPPRVTIDASRLVSSWVVRVTDNGLGIPLDKRETVFEVFKRLDVSDQPGEGLGLAIAKRIVEQHDGRIWVESGRDGGTTIAMELSAAGAAPPRTVDHGADEPRPR
jgi:PAS domain S-box-containing protein